MTSLKNTALWKAFRAKATDRQSVMVSELAAAAATRLGLVRDTFPTYTLHDETHALNVVRLVGDLLGPEVEKLSALEGALLILSAYCHDIGMVFTEQEREGIREEPAFRLFLDEFPEAALRVAREGRLAAEVAEAYCRWRHPDRVYEFLKSVPKEKVLWGKAPLLDKLGEVCRSHGHDARELLDETFKTDYLSQADLRFCAILLRLADILDFDNTRSPEEVYGYLGLGRRDKPREKASDVEWLKHLSSEGFRFPDERPPRYSLKIIAAPDHPAVEYDVRQFLDAIEGELQKCASLLKHCSKRWQGFSLPGEIDRSDIHSRGYKYGAYRFTLEQERILELLMGENLYEDPYVFVRELLQNAIDTSRHRAHFERSRGRADFKPDPIVVSTWLDRDSYRWVRVDDSGMGMSEEIIARYFLKVGESYYRSPQFRADQLAYEQAGQPEFVPVSRFGIGVLSCFIAGDRVEVSTRYAGDGKTPAHSARLQLSGLHSFYVLQSERDRHYDPAPMPGPDGGDERDYRQGQRFGTSVAVRLDPRRENRQLDLKATLERYLLCPPVPVLLDGEPIGGDPEKILDKPWADGVVEEELTDDEMARLEELFDGKFADKIKLRLVPLDLTAHSPTPNLKGQALLAYLFTSSDDDAAERLGRIRFTPNTQGDWQRTLSLDIFRAPSEGLGVDAHAVNYAETEKLDAEAMRLNAKMDELRRESSEPEGAGGPAQPGELLALEQRASEIASLRRRVKVGRRLSIDLGRVFDRINLGADEFSARAAGTRWLTHNGILVPTGFGNQDNYIVRLDDYYQSGDIDRIWLRYVVALSDSLRPDISLSRDRVMSLSWNIYSTVTLAIMKAYGAAGMARPHIMADAVFDQTPGKEYFLLRTMLSDPFIHGGEWAAQKIILTEQGMISLDEIRSQVGPDTPVVIKGLPDIDHTFHGVSISPARVSEMCAAALVQTGLKVRLRIAGKVAEYVAASGEAPPIRDGQMLFPPLFFVPYEGADVLRYGDYPLNQSHPFSEWLIERAPALHEKYPGIFDTVRKSVSLSRGNINDAAIADLNAALDRLWVLDRRLRPSRKIRLGLKDLVVYGGAQSVLVK